MPAGHLCPLIFTASADPFMPVSTNPSDRTVLFGAFGLWPRWKEVQFTGTFTHEFTDGSYNNDGGVDLFGGDISTVITGTASHIRWATAHPDSAFFRGTALDFGAAFSEMPTDGGLYTAQGSVLADTDITGAYDFRCSYDWATYPALSAPPPGDIAMRSRSAGRLVRGVPDYTGHFSWSWAAESSTSVGVSSTMVVAATDFTPEDFALSLLTTARTFTRSKVQTITFHPDPAADDPGIGYYPTRGSTVRTRTAEIQIAFVV